jgi:hypothetical protein
MWCQADDMSSFFFFFGTSAYLLPHTTSFGQIGRLHLQDSSITGCQLLTRGPANVKTAHACSYMHTDHGTSQYCTMSCLHAGGGQPLRSAPALRPPHLGNVSDQKGNSKNGCQQNLIYGCEFVYRETLVIRVLAQDPDVVNARCMHVDQYI